MREVCVALIVAALLACGVYAQVETAAEDADECAKCVVLHTLPTPPGTRVKLSDGGECVSATVITEDMERPIYVMHGFHASKFECVDGNTWEKVCAYLKPYYSFDVTFDSIDLQPAEILIVASVYGHWQIFFRYILDEELLTPGSHELRGVWTSSGDDCDCLNLPNKEELCVDGIVDYEELCTTILTVSDSQ